MSTATYITLPEWTYAGAQQDLYTLGAALVLAGYENKWVKLTAKQQRAILGDARIGKQSVGIFDGELMVTRSVCFGTDRDTRIMSPASPAGAWR